MTDMHSSVGSYVVHALDDGDVEEFEAHLADCEDCSREIREFREATAELGLLTDTPPAPPQLRASVLGAIAQVRPLPPLVPGEDDYDDLPFQPAPLVSDHPRHAVSPWSPVEAETYQGLVFGTAEPTPGDGAGSEVVRTSREDDRLAPVTDLAAVRRRRFPRALIAVAAAVALIAIGAGGWALNLNRQLEQQQADQAVQSQQQAQQQAAADREAAILRAPDAQVKSAAVQGGGRVSYVVSKQLNAGVVLTSDLANPASGRTYQLWTVRNGKFVPDVTFSGGANQRIFFTTDVDKAGAAGLTIEPAGGSSQPTMDPFAVQTL